MVAVVQFALSTSAAGNTQDILAPSGFGTPKAAIFIRSGGTVNGAVATTSRQSYGFTDGTSQAVIDTRATNNAGTTSTQRGHRTDSVLMATGSGATPIVLLSFNRWLTQAGDGNDGVRLDIDDASGNAFLCTAIFFGPDDVISAKVLTKDDLGTGTSPIDINTVGFQPDAVNAICTGNATALPNHRTTGISSIGWGINDGSDTQRIVAFNNGNAKTTTAVGTYLGNDSIVGQVTASALGWDAVIGSYDASGFSITPNASAGSDIVSFLCIELVTGVNIDLFDVDFPALGDYSETTPGFLPSFGMLYTEAGATARNSYKNSGGSGFNIAAFDSDGISSNSISSKDNVGTSVESSLADTSLNVLDDNGFTTLIKSSAYVFTADGWDFTISTSPGTTVRSWGLAIGPASAATILKTLSYTAIGSATVTDTLDLGKSFSYTATGSSSLTTRVITAVQKLLFYGATGTAALSKLVIKALPYNATGTAGLSKALTLSKLLAYTGIGTAVMSVSGSVKIGFAYVASGSASLSKKVGKTLGFTGTGTTEQPAKAVSKNLSYTATGTASESEDYITTKSFSYIATGIASLATRFIAKPIGGALRVIRRIGHKIGLGL